MEEMLYHDLLVELECPICTNYMSPPIRQCCTGHSICEPCRKRLPQCPLCQGRFTESRNISLEGLAVKMPYPCMNKSSGCHVKLSYNEREAHEAKCRFKGFKCPMEKCTWVGKLEEISSHWASKKMSSKPYHASNVCHTKLKSESYYVNMIEAFNNLFWFKCKLMKNKLYWAVQFIGKVSNADNFCYEIECFKAGRPKRKILFSDYCQTIDLENSELFKEDTCISVNCETVNRFISDDQMLFYYLRVQHVSGSPARHIPQIEASSSCDKGAKQRDRSKGPQAYKNQKPKRCPQGKKTTREQEM